jgi:hypothetical protein
MSTETPASHAILIALAVPSKQTVTVQPASGGFPSQSVVVLAGDLLAITGQSGHPGVRMWAELTGLVTVA